VTHTWFEEEDEAPLEDLGTPRRWRHPPTGVGLSILEAAVVVALLLTVLFGGLR
jgi:hypothetical protein